ncbi:MAG TPA: phosphatase PAP2 family protein [Sediminibacterium sp.]|nr:phosphatase PAP2 family protein [Sediminibacterium sp.]
MADSSVSVNLFSKKSLLAASLLSAGYLLLSHLLIGYRPEQLVLVALFNLAFFSSAGSRKFVTGFSIFILFWILFDYMKAFPNYRYAAVHIGDLYQAEKNWFGIVSGGSLVTPNEYWLAHTQPWLDLATGIAYLCWVPVPLIFAGYLFFRNRAAFLDFALNFLLVNLIGFLIYYLYPAAPPWYVQQHGFLFQAATPGNTGGLIRFDAALHTALFEGLYSKSSNVFAAMPSLHSAYPVILLYYGIRNRLGWINLFFACLMFSIWFSAIYNSHHYVLDVIAGIVCALASILLYRMLAARTAWFPRFLQLFVRAIT